MLVKDDLYLLGFDELNTPNDLGYSEREKQSIDAVQHWVSHYLCRDHEEIGRPGVVCPFVKPGVNKYKSIHFSVYRPEDTGCSDLPKKIVDFGKWFDVLPPLDKKTRSFKAIILMLPTLTDSDEDSVFIECIHKELKTDFVKRGLMLGQFYPKCPEPGLHNENFKPLQSPVPMFVIRHMQVTDLYFLASRKEYLDAYCKNFDINNQAQLAEAVRKQRVPKLPNGWEQLVNRVFPEPSAAPL